MTNNFTARLKAVDRTALTPLVRNAIENEAAEVVDWCCQPLDDGLVEAGHSYGLYRFEGTAQIHDKIVPWSLILKATGGPFGSDIPAHWQYWKREMLAYQSGLLDDLPGGLVAPRCYGTVEYPGDESWIWIEDIAEEMDTWPLERYGLAARHLGQFNGAYLAGRARPEASWLSGGRVRDWLAESEPTIRNLRRISQHPLAQLWFKGDSVERTLRLWTERAVFLQVLGRLPRSLCHHDAFRRNLLARSGPDGQEQTVAIDWAIMGTGAVGEEIATLAGMTLRYLDVDGSQAKDLDAIVFDGYLNGLRDAGWTEDEALVRFGFTASAALYIGVAEAGLTLDWALSDEAEAECEQESGYSLDYLLAQQAPIQEYLLDLGDEARTLLKAI